MHIKKESYSNRIHHTFTDAIHFVDDMNISNHMVTAKIKSYASLESYNYKEENQDEPNLSDGRAIAEEHQTLERKYLDKYESDESIEDPFEQIKHKVLQYLVAELEKYSGGEIII